MPKKKNEIKGVEVFSAGTWNGDKYSEKELDGMVDAFNDLKETMLPHLKLGHDKDQKLLQNDGLPAAGWVTNLYRKGQKLFADFSEIPEKIYELVRRGAYRKVSAEIYENVEVGAKKYPNVFGGVALLGADMPAVVTLDDILANYSAEKTASKFFSKESDASNLRTYTFENESDERESGMDELKKAQEELAALKAKDADREKELGELKTFKVDNEKRMADLEKKSIESEQAAAQARLEASVDKLVSEKVLSPAMKPYAMALLGEDKKEYAIKAGDKELKLSKLELVKGLADLKAEAIKLNTKENTRDGENIPQGEEAEAAVQKIMSDKKCSYKEAYKIFGQQKLAAGEKF